MRAAFWGAIVAQDVLCRKAKMFFTDAELDEFQKLTEIALSTYNWLAVNAYQNGKKLYFVPPKAHMFDHIAWDQAPQINPR